MKNRISAAATNRTTIGSRNRSAGKKQSRSKSRSPYFTSKTHAQLKGFVDTLTDRRQRALLWMLLDSDLRPTEVLSLNRGQVRIAIADRRDISVPTTGTGRLSQFAEDPGRKFTVGSRAITALRDYVSKDRMAGDGHALFTEKSGQRMTLAALMELIHGWVREAKARSR